ncbi:peptidylprolyl isomerase [Oscillatoria sp. FACHB-1407]|uniref:peptidylprolyl isomerase n=1 Tax=Oscillatoria sp. FACHB-1407 TaxID=2692847 RepID=UPI001F5540F0|nr:peptidylprolyl isomerase [Oscillatoria sp. FACHB-1407]
MKYTSFSVFETMDQVTVSESISISRLASYQLIPQLLCESIVDRAIASISCTAEETAIACQQLYQRWQLDSPEQQQAWRSHYGLTQEQLELIATREQRIQTFKQLTWGHKLKSYFLQRKHDLDQVIYSLLRTRQHDLAQELYFRIQEGEQSFADLVYQYSEGEEVKTGGLVGPIELGMLRQELANLFYSSQVGEAHPLKLGEWCLIVRLEKRIPAQLDETMQQRLLQEQFDEWLRSHIQELNEFDQRWFGVHLERSLNSAG